MGSLLFEVEFLSDIVLPASSNTEGNIAQLEFIPGSNFLGMVAKEYPEFQKRGTSFDIFHSGAVRFGDATLLVDEQEYFKMPFSLFHPKLNEKEIYHHHFLTENKGQLEQMRKGYISPDMNDGLKVKYIDYNYAQKSAYDTTNRRSKTSSMYGYSAIASGTKWQFMVHYDNSISNDDVELIKRTLENSKRLGKSKSAQYGAIEITYIGTGENSSKVTETNGEVLLYAKSRLALVDREGNATYDLSYLVEGADVVYDKCQIRTSSFTPYNGTMRTKSYERMVIEKGSVIVLKSVTDKQLIALQSGVGAYLAEGFGELLINPEFLIQSGEISLLEQKTKKQQKDQREEITASFKNETVQFLVNRHNKNINDLRLADEVQKFITANNTLYKNIKNAQWGTIRAICTHGGENFLGEIEAYISSGKVAWSKTQIERLLPETKYYSLEFIKLLTIQMPKEENRDD